MSSWEGEIKGEQELMKAWEDGSRQRDTEDYRELIKEEKDGIE